MRTIRRLYLYSFTFISLETVLWGLINLLRAALDTSRVGGATDQLAGALAFLIVGLPFFLLHWWLVQRSVDQPEERAAGLRAVFLYGVLLALLLPIAQNTLAGLNRALLALFSVAPREALVGSGQSWTDNIVGLLMNGLLFLYFGYVLRQEWRVETWDGKPDLENLTLARRIFRYVLMLYTLGMAVFGLQQTLESVFSQLARPSVGLEGMLANGLSLLILGAPGWWFFWQRIQRSLEDEAEQQSMVRLVVLYLLAFIGVGGVLIQMGAVLYESLRAVLGSSADLGVWFGRIAAPLSGGLVFVGLWTYYAGVLRWDLDQVPPSPRRDALQRLYRYVLAFAGLAAVFIGMLTLVNFINSAIFEPRDMLELMGTGQLASGLSAILIGLPLWLQPWLRVAREAKRDDETGDHARRSSVRKGYLYLVVFVGVVGVMLATGGLVNELLRIMLGSASPESGRTLAQIGGYDLLFALLLAYHLRVLRQDTRRAAQFLAEKQSLFPVLVFDPGDEIFSDAVMAAIREEAPEIPVAVHFPSAGAPDEQLADAGAVVMPGAVAANPPEALRIWLRAYQGARLVVPVAEEGWIWVDSSGRPLNRLAKQTARAVRELAEGGDLGTGGGTSPWVIAAAVFGGLVALMILISGLSEFIR
jgi:hypothetical protein